MRVTHKLECPIDEAEIQNAKDALARQTVEYNRLAAEEKERASEVRADLKARQDELGELAARALRGVTMKEVKCEERVDVDRGKKIVVRLDTGKVVPELEEDYDVEKHEPLTAKARKNGKSAAAATPAKGDAKPPKANAGAAVDWVMVIDVDGKKRKVAPQIAETLRRSNREGLRCVHGFGPEEPNVELAMVEGEPVYGVDAKGNGVPLTPGQVKVLRESFAARTPFRATVGGKDVEIVGLKGGPMIPSKPPEKASKKSAAKKGGRGRKAEARA